MFALEPSTVEGVKGKPGMNEWDLGSGRADDLTRGSSAALTLNELRSVDPQDSYCLAEHGLKVRISKGLYREKQIRPACRDRVAHISSLLYGIPI